MTSHDLVEQGLAAPRPATRVPSYSWTHRALETTAIVVVVVLAVQAAFHVARAVNDMTLVWVFGGAMVTGYLAADVVSGLGHWAADTYGSEQTPVIGVNFIRPFRQHHLDPEDIVRHDFVETCGNSCIGAAPVLGATLWWMPGPDAGAGWLFAWTALLAWVPAIVATNQFHKWAHMASPPAPALALQRLGVILSREHHAVHHVAPFRTHYCITTGWMNAPFQRARLHEALEWLLARCGVSQADGANAGA
jgi:ubiquitin-conjugating enzyme E2 variant